jgi:hypothetical protein
MKRIAMSLLFLLIVPALAYAQPSILFHDVAYDFGTVSQGDKIEHLFEFVNDGDAELVIEKVSGS